jgi:hypothetical protein
VSTATNSECHREVQLRVRYGLPLAQVAALALLAWTMTRQSDATSTTVDQSFVVILLAATLSLGVLAWAGWALLKVTWSATPRLPLALAIPVEAATLLIATALALATPVSVLGAWLVGPIG